MVLVQFEINDMKLVDRIYKYVEHYKKTNGNYGNEYYYKNRDKMIEYNLRKYHENKKDKVECGVCKRMVYSLENHEKSKLHIRRTTKLTE